MLLQVAAFAPALPVGAAVMVNVLVSINGTQLPLPLIVSVSVTSPVWPAEGVYVGVNVVALVSVPVPLADQLTDDELAELASFTV